MTHCFISSTDWWVRHPCKPPSLSSFQSNLLVWLPALSPYRSSQLHQQCFIGHCFNLGGFFLFSAPSSPPSITLQCKKSLLSTPQCRKKIKGELVFDTFYFILSIHISPFQDWQKSDYCHHYHHHDTTVRISRNTNENQTLSVAVWDALGHIVLACGLCGWGLVVSNPGRLGTESQLPEGTKPLKCSLSLYISSLIITLQAAEQGTRENISCYLKLTALRLQLSSKCWPAAWEPGNVLFNNSKNLIPTYNTSELNISF